MSIFSTVLTPTAGLPGRSYGDFAGKEGAASRSGQFTALGPTAGLPGMRYGSFAGKESAGAYVLTLDSGAYAITGATAGLNTGRKLTLASGAYTITGAAATLTYFQPGTYILSCESGSYTITGSNAGINAGRKLTLTAGVYTITGSGVTLTHSAAPVAVAPNRRTITPLSDGTIIPLIQRTQTRH